MLRRLMFEYDRPLRHDEVKLRNGEVTVIWFRPEAAGPVLTIRSSSGVDGNVVVVRANLEDVRRAVEQVDAGTFVIDLNCDLVLDEEHQPVSSCMTGLIARHLPRPGGILRTWLLVRG